MSTVYLCHVTVLMPSGWRVLQGVDVDCVSMSCDRVHAFRMWMSTVCLCHTTVFMPSGRGWRLCVYVMWPC